MDILDTPLFGVLISLITFEIGLFIYRKSKISLFNPILISVTLIIVFIISFDIPYEKYKVGGDFINFFLKPATVVLAVPLYKKIDIFKKNFIPILSGITMGCISSILSIILLSKVLDLPANILKSLIPKSITTPIGIEVSSQLGGIPSVTVTAIIITGIIGAVIGPTICKWFGLKDSVAVGISMGTSSHAIGTSKAIELGEIQGAMSGLAIGLAGLVTVLLVPILMTVAF